MSDNAQKLAVNGIIGSVIEIDDGTRLFVEREIADGMLLIQDTKAGAAFRVENPLDGTLAFPDAEWVEEMLRHGRLRIVSGPGIPTPAPKVADELDHDEILKLDPMALARWTLVRRLGPAVASDPDLSRLISEAWDDDMRAKYGDRPKTSTVRTWLSWGDPLEVTLGDMMSETGRVPRARRLDPEIVEILWKRAHWFYEKKGRTQKDVRSAIIDDVDQRNLERAELGLDALECPSKETIRREINRHLNRDSFAEKWGEAAAKSKWDGAGKGLTAPKILALCLIDDTVLDTIAVFDADRGVPAGRPWLCLILDVHSRCILGWVLSFTPPTVHTAAECIRRANRPKSIRPDRLARYPVLAKIGGRMSALLADNAPNYASPKFQTILADMGITLRLAATRSPTHKAMIERVFFTLKTWLLQKLPGATFETKLMREFDLDPEKEAILTLSELELLIDEFVFGYHISIHSGIGTQPANKWRASMETYGRDTIADERKLKILTGITKHNRRLYRGAIRMFGLTWRDRERSAQLNADLVGAEPHRRRVRGGVVATVKIKYDPADLSEIHVWNHVAKTWVALPCTDQTYARRLTLWQHQQVRKWAGKHNLAFNTERERLEALRQLNELIRELAPDMRARERRAVARMTGNPIAQPERQVEIAYADPRHDGLGPVIEHSTAEDREDADHTPSRPPRNGGRRKAPDEDSRLEQEAEELEPESEDDLLDADDDDDSQFEEYE